MPNTISLRDVTDADLPILFEYQRDLEANRMAAFTARDPEDRIGFMAHWATILNDDRLDKQAVVFDGQVVGSMVSFEMEGHREVGYWIGREFWGKGIATQALALFLDQVKVRPLYGYCAKDNIGSIRVLEKCGFAICGETKEFSNARGEDVEQVILRLDGSE